jgi:hypothetical protein
VVPIKSSKKNIAASKKAVRILKKPSPEQLKLNERQQKAISDYFAWEKRSAQKEFVVGQPLFS